MGGGDAEADRGACPTPIGIATYVALESTAGPHAWTA